MTGGGSQYDENYAISEGNVNRLETSSLLVFPMIVGLCC